MVDRSQKREPKHGKKDDQMLSLHIFSASFLTSRPRSLLFIPVGESLNPLFSSKTDSKEKNSFSPSSLTVIVHISQKLDAWNKIHEYETPKVMTRFREGELKSYFLPI